MIHTICRRTYAKTPPFLNKPFSEQCTAIVPVYEIKSQKSIDGISTLLSNALRSQQNGDDQKAIRVYKRVFEVQQQFDPLISLEAVPMERKGDFFSQNKNYPLAARFYKKAVMMNQHDLIRYQGKPELEPSEINLEIKNAYTTQNASSYAITCNKLGVDLVLNKKYQEAIPYFIDAMKESYTEENVSIGKNLIGAYLGAYSQYPSSEDSLTYLEKAIQVCNEYKIGEKLGLCHCTMGLLLQKLGREEEAQEQFASARMFGVNLG